MRKPNDGGEEEQWRSVLEVLQIVLQYLPSVYEVLSMSRLCQSLRNSIRHETALWANIVVDAPLSPRLSDEILSDITSRAAGKLTTLILRQCPRITDEGLRRVVDANPLITTMIVKGCTGLTPEGIVIAVQILTKNNHKLETLHVDGIYGFTKDHLSVIRSYLPPSAIDVDVCPKCDQVRMIPPCSRQSCMEQRKDRGCKGCRFCIQRCVECGVCVVGSDAEVEETVCGDVLCLDCWLLLLPKCSFCNKPYCSSHQQLAPTAMADQSLFVCEACQLAPSAMYDDFEW
ncbi:PREDICTED: F-box protein SKIP28 [Tarenaya hassleriana]|uniref:F-box protein SKIP28 n=1 Tax=Tarenaya hassleriana TaxID=28532 RepID=UPI00053C68B3|nr:PREDICTED: F-box protein SKIP28 [Tarenaya hassleriana]